jgi:hypothetical protein
MCPTGSRTALHPTRIGNSQSGVFCDLLRKAPGDHGQILFSNSGFRRQALRNHPCQAHCSLREETLTAIPPCRAAYGGLHRTQLAALSFFLSFSVLLSSMLDLAHDLRALVLSLASPMLPLTARAGSEARATRLLSLPPKYRDCIVQSSPVHSALSAIVRLGELY